MYEVTRQKSELVSGENKKRVDVLVNLVSKYSNLVGRLSAANILGRFLEESGYVAAMALGGYHRNIQNMKKLVSDAQNSGIVGVADFLNTITDLRNIAVREGEAASVAEGAVQIMTVHQAKGLEFPIVILGDVSKKDRFGRDILVDPLFGIVPPLTETRISETDPKKPELVTSASLAYEIALERERLREEAESNRLFYVAATRAQEMLIISGVLGKLNKDQTLGKFSGWLEKIDQTLGLKELSLKFDVQGDATYTYEIRRNGIEADLFVYENQVEFELELEKQIQSSEPVPVVHMPVIPDLNFEKSPDLTEQNNTPWYISSNCNY